MTKKYAEKMKEIPYSAVGFVIGACLAGVSEKKQLLKLDYKDLEKIVSNRENAGIFSKTFNDFKRGNPINKENAEGYVPSFVQYNIAKEILEKRDRYKEIRD